MPAHYTAEHEGIKTLSNGQPLASKHRIGNAAVDAFAKEVARKDAPPKWQIQAVADATEKLTAIGKWLGHSCAYANRFPLPDHLRTSRSEFIRDSEASKQVVKKPRPLKRKAASQLTPPAVPGDLSGCPRWVALRERIRARSAAASQSEPP